MSPDLPEKVKKQDIGVFTRRTGFSLLLLPLTGGLIGLGIDWLWPSEISWAMVLALLGIAAGCFNVWRWYKRP